MISWRWFFGFLFISFLFQFFTSSFVDANTLFPLAPRNWWEFEGEVAATGEKFKTKIIVEEPEVLCGIKVTPLLFVKDKTVGYWGPGADLNLRWFVADWMGGFLRAVGDKRYVRNPANWEVAGRFESFVWYLGSGESKAPVYTIFPKYLVLGTSLTGPVQKYPSVKEDRQDCDWVLGAPAEEKASWRVSYNWSKVSTEAYSGKAVRVSFVEDFGGRGWIEDWYFAEGIGPVQIETFVQGEEFNAVDKSTVKRRLKLSGLALNFIFSPHAGRRPSMVKKK